MQPAAPPVITFLSDFGLDGAAATCRGVMISISPTAQIIDIAHTIRKFSIAEGSFLMAASLPYMPVGIHVGVVDPGVGTDRKPIGLQTARGDILIGPDNGLLIDPAAALGGIAKARALTNRRLWRSNASSTFHGRDIFSPVGAHLAAGDATFADVGDELRPADLVTLAPPKPSVELGLLDTRVTYVDSFGNVRLAGSLAELAGALGALSDLRPVVIELPEAGVGGVVEETRYATTFGMVPRGASLVYIDSLGHVAFADNQGDAARRLGVRPGQRVRIRPGA
jgi:S-adenosyl-L-methionine hydrolase (adenosine-forming)